MNIFSCCEKKKITKFFLVFLFPFFVLIYSSFQQYFFKNTFYFRLFQICFSFSIGGWWVGGRDNPKHWQRNTAIVIGAGALITFAALYGATRVEVNQSLFHYLF